MDDSNFDELKKKNEHPQLKSSFLCNLFFCWGLPIFYKGCRKDLDEDDLYRPFQEHESHRLGDQLEELWKLEKIEHKEPALWRALWKMFKIDIIKHIFVIIFLEFGLRVTQPLLLGKLMDYYAPHQTTVTIREAYICAGLIILSSFLYVLVNHSYLLSRQHLGMKIRVACCSLIYRKTLRLSKKALVKTTIGQMINLLSNDVNRFDTCFNQFHYLWVAPLETMVVMYLLYRVVGITGLTGFSLLLFLIPFQMVLGKLITIFRLKTAEKTDERVRLMNEIVSGMQVIKMYAWEKPFSILVNQIRRSEVKQISYTSYVKALHMSFSKVITRTSVFLCILTYTFMGNRPDAKYVYVISSFYNILKSAMNTDFPQAVTQFAETFVSVRRIQEFLLFDEIHLGDANKFYWIGAGNNVYTSTPLKHANKVGISLQDVHAKWHQQEETLRNVSFYVRPGQLVAVVGAIGSGKSSLLHVIMRELPLTKGFKDITGRISYASQDSWLFAGTIKQNILFGEEWDREKYEKVIKACALERDLTLLPYGDKSMVGDRGISLSGGQKARINLARAVYKDADIYLLDDPLSAVDAHVGKQLFDDCICGYLKGRCIVLVTHQLQYLRNVDKIYLMEAGTVVSSGTYEDIRNSKEDFAKLFKDSPTEDEECDDTIDQESSKIKYFGNICDDEPSEVKEFRKVGGISSKVYRSYVKAGNGWCCFFFVFLLFVLSQFAASGADFFAKFWVNLEQTESENKLHFNDSFPPGNYSDVANEKPYAESMNNKSERQLRIERFFTVDNCIYVYTAIIAFVIVITIARSIAFYKFCMVASVKLYRAMFNSVCNATMLFFHSNCSGRILNRFSKDTGAIDEVLPQVLVDTIQIGLNVLAVNILIATINYWILIPTFVILLIFYIFKVVYISSSRNIKRMESTTRSPVFSHISASLQGLTTIRAFGAQEILRQEFDRHQDLHSSAFYMFLGCNRAFGFWLDMLCVAYIGIVTVSFFFFGGQKFGGSVGLAISQAMSLTGMFQHGMQQWSELDNTMTSVERVVEYTDLKQESVEEKKDPPETWPETGMVELQSVYLRYATNEPYVLNNLTFKIKPKEKVGIVGRTGAGKSSLISALFRLADIEGKILIDGICTSDIPLRTLRSKIAIIPQEPVLFSGTVRSNLDPLNEYDDRQLWNALDDVELKGVISDLNLGLDSKISEGGSNISVGQRQLICLARAIVKNNKILVLDEATANVDPKTDALIQTTIRKKFADCTVLTIAHRLHTVMDSDKVLVMDAGSAMEFDHPHTLVQDTESMFYALVKETGKAMAEHLAEIAKKRYNDVYDTTR